MKILIAPLNWGLGHATRCLPLIVRHLRAGDDVVLAGDGESGLLLRKHFPGLRYIPLPELNLRYSKGRSQIGAVAQMIPKILVWSAADHKTLEQLLRRESFDLVISDNRPGLYSRRCRCAYITHQLLIRMPGGLRFLEDMGHKLHLRIIRRFSECWVPDSEGENNLSGDLAHRYPLPQNARFIGPLSRFEYVRPEEGPGEYNTVAVISGLEPQRSLFEKAVLDEYAGKNERLLVVRGKIGGANMTVRKGNVTLMPAISDESLARHLLSARTVISRSGYSSIMDYAALGLPEKQRRGELSLRLVPTPGQPEQEYLAEWMKTHTRN